MGNWWDSLIAPFTPARISGYDFGDPMPAGGWTGTGESFGWSKHLGTDFGTPSGEAIKAPGAGTASYRTGVAGYGNELIVQLANGFTWIFGHVASGISGPVQQGQKIGTTGHDIGSSKGAVTLVQVLDPTGKAINPDPILSRLWETKSSNPFDPVAAGLGDFFGRAAGSFDPTDPLGLQGLATNVGHGIADGLAITEGNIGDWFGKQAIALFVAAIVLLVLFL